MAAQQTLALSWCRRKLLHHLCVIRLLTELLLIPGSRVGLGALACYSSVMPQPVGIPAAEEIPELSNRAVAPLVLVSVMARLSVASIMVYYSSNS